MVRTRSTGGAGAWGGRAAAWLTLGAVCASLGSCWFVSRGSPVEGPVAIAAGVGVALTLAVGGGLLAWREREEARLARLAREREKQDDALVAALDAAILVLDEEARIAALNPAAEALLGFPQHEVRGFEVSMLVDELADRTKLRGGGRITVARHRDSHEIPVDLRITSVQRGERRLWVLLLRDLIPQRTAERATREAEALRATLAKVALEALVVFDAEGRIVDVNPEAERLFGKPLSQLRGKDVAEVLLPRARRGSFRRELREDAIERDPWCGRPEEVELQIAGRPMCRARLALAKLSSGEQPRFLACVVEHDVARPAERVAPAQTAAAAPVALDGHEVQRDIGRRLAEPVRLVAGYTELVNQHAAGKLDPNAEQFLALAVDGSKRLQKIVDELLDGALQ